ncbi:MAG: hypothetical protein ACFE95_09780 [Candidatus Hodarchaeota archaeon]
MKRNTNGQKFILIKYGGKSKRDVIEEYLNFSITSKNSEGKKTDLNLLENLPADRNYEILYRKQAFYRSQKVRWDGKLRKPIFISEVTKWKSGEKKIHIKEADGEWGIIKLYRLENKFIVELKPFPHLSQIDIIRKEFNLVSTALKEFNKMLDNPFN